MKKIITSLFFMIAFCSVLTAQNYSSGSITVLNNNPLEGSVAIDYLAQTVLYKKNYKTTVYTFDQVTSVSLNNRNLDKIEVDNIVYFATPLQDGKASLYQISPSEYLITNATGTSKVINVDNDRANIAGTLAVLFSDCNSIRRPLNAIDQFNESALIRNVQAYNACDYEIYAPTPNEVDAAASYNTDAASFYLGVGTSVNNLKFFDSDDSESIVTGQVQLGVIATPGFLGTLQGNLYFSLEGNAALSGDNSFENLPNDLNFKMSSFRLLFGLEYQFNKEGKLKPFVAAAVGPTGDYYEGTLDGNDFDISGGNPIFVPRVGVRYELSNGHHLSASLSYITGYDNDLTFPTEEEVIPLQIDVTTLTLGINYYF